MVYQAEAHIGVGGPGTAPCSGDPLLSALAACAQLTCQMVATAIGSPVERLEMTAEGDLYLRVALGIAKDVSVDFQAIRVRFDIEAPQARAERLTALREKTKRFCVIMQTLSSLPAVEVRWE